MRKGKFITIEGVEGAGKSTAMSFIKAYLAQTKKNIINTREPGGTKVSEKIRDILLQPSQEETIQPLTELLLMFACRVQHLAHIIVPALAQGSWVVSDRYIDATYAYQGGGRRIDMATITALDKLVVNDLYPNLTLLLDVPPEVGFARTTDRDGKDRIEQEKLDFFIRVRNVYLERAKLDPKRIKVIDASLRLHDVQAQITQQLKLFLEET